MEAVASRGSWRLLRNVWILLQSRAGWVVIVIDFVGVMWFFSSKIFGRWGGVDHCEATGAFFGVYLLWRQSWNHKVKPP